MFTKVRACVHACVRACLPAYRCTSIQVFATTVRPLKFDIRRVLHEIETKLVSSDDILTF